MTNKVYLAQTDTTVGFLSRDMRRLNRLKGRDENMPCIKAMAEFRELCLHVRVPNNFKRFVRYAKGVTFIYPNKEACRVVKEPFHSDFLSKHRWLYSTSANKTKEKFNETFAKIVVDEVIYDERGFFEAKPSDIIKLGRKSKKRVRV